MKSSLFRLLSILLSVVLISIIVGSISALFLESLDWVTNKRESNFILVLLLPLGGAIIGFSYYYLEKGVSGGNNLLIQEMIVPQKKIHWKLTPLILAGTLLTHLFGGSAGREGTAVQMGGATADQFNGVFNLPRIDRKLMLRMGVAAGFAGVFGTPIAGLLFALELGRDKKLNFKWIIPILLTSYISDYVCHVWSVNHTNYTISDFSDHSLISYTYILLAGLLFGLCALIFNYSKEFFIFSFQKIIKYPPLRPIIGGVFIVIVLHLLGTTQYIGLGIPHIQAAFSNENSFEVFLIKLLLTAFTLGAGFKGGEATPLFYIGATLGSFLVLFIPLPLSLLAGLGFIAVFSGATNTPLACTFLGCELFGYEGFLQYAMVCFIAFLISGKTSIYYSQRKYLSKVSILEKYRSTLWK